MLGIFCFPFSKLWRPIKWHKNAKKYLNSFPELSLMANPYHPLLLPPHSWKIILMGNIGRERGKRECVFVLQLDDDGHFFLLFFAKTRGASEATFCVQKWAPPFFGGCIKSSLFLFLKRKKLFKGLQRHSSPFLPTWEKMGKWRYF